MSARRAAHIARVVALLGRWAGEMRVSDAETGAWRDAGRFHDALRDAPEGELRVMLGDRTSPAKLLHGPAAAARLRADGEQRADVLDAVAHHTVGSLSWAGTGRALYMADFLEPGREFAHAERAALAARVPVDFDAAFREVVRLRIEWARHAGLTLHPQTLALWDGIQ